MTAQIPSRVRVLHVDDDPSVTDLVSILLERDFLEFEVLTAHSVEGGLELLENNEIDCIVSDYDLEGRNGIEFLTAVRSNYPKLPFILFTGKGSEEVAAEAIREGLTEYVQKGGTEKISLLGTQIRNVVSTYRVEQERHERVKELSVLHDSMAILFEDRSLEERINSLVRTLPSGCRHPEHTGARVTIDGEPYETHDFADTGWTQKVSVTTSYGTRIELELAYIEPWDGDISPFSDEEYELLSSLASILRSHLERTDVIERLKRTNQQLEALLDVTPAIVHLKDTDGRYLRVNDEYEVLLGKPRSDILGKTVHEVHPAETAEEFLEHDRRVLERGESVEFEETIERDDQTTTYLTSRVPLFDEEGEPYAVYGISTDISEQVEMITEREQILNRMTDAFFAIDTECRFTFVNEHTAKLFDREVEELVGAFAAEEFPQVIDTTVHDEFKRALATQEAVSFEADYEPLGTTFDVRAYPSETGLSVYFRDVSAE